MLVEEDSNENIFELQHHHLLRCLEKTTVKMIMLEKLLTKLLRIESGWVEREREVLSPLIRQNTEELLLFDAE